MWRDFPLAVWEILLATMVLNGAYWMTWPFLIMMLHQNQGLETSTIGLILSTVTIISSLLGIYASHLSDRFGRRQLSLVGTVIGIAAFTLLAFAHQTFSYIAAVILVGIARALIDPMSKALMGDFLPSKKLRAVALHWRYFAVNAGAAIGPLVGLHFGLLAQQPTFLIAASAYMMYAFILLSINMPKKNTSLQQQNNQQSFLQTWRILSKDYSFLLMILANLFFWIIIVQFESSIPQYFAILHMPSLVHLLSVMITASTLTIVTCQFLMMKLTQNWTLAQRLYFGLIILAGSQLMYAFVPIHHPGLWISAAITYSIAEVILAPNINVAIDRMAPDHMRGSYYGVTYLYRIGCGAYIGGLLLHYSGHRTLFITMTALCGLIAVLFALSMRLQQTLIPDHNLI
ncbi:MAG: MFS transporter [Coxiellaceae bacterium]|nr:MFS transporter [Coxiellaceae bacterium]